MKVQYSIYLFNILKQRALLVTTLNFVNSNYGSAPKYLRSTQYFVSFNATVISEMGPEKQLTNLNALQYIDFVDNVFHCVSITQISFA